MEEVPPAATMQTSPGSASSNRLQIRTAKPRPASDCRSCSMAHCAGFADAIGSLGSNTIDTPRAASLVPRAPTCAQPVRMPPATHPLAAAICLKNSRRFTVDSLGTRRFPNKSQILSGKLGVMGVNPYKPAVLAVRRTTSNRLSSAMTWSGIQPYNTANCSFTRRYACGTLNFCKKKVAKGEKGNHFGFRLSRRKRACGALPFRCRSRRERGQRGLGHRRRSA